MPAHLIKISAIFLSESEKKLLRTFIRVLNGEYKNVFFFSDDHVQADFLVIDIDNSKGADQYKTYSSFGLGALHQAVAYSSAEMPGGYKKTFLLHKPLRSSEVETLLQYCLRQQPSRLPAKKIAGVF